MKKAIKILAFAMALLIVFSLNMHIVEQTGETKYHDIDFEQSNSYTWVIILLFTYLVTDYCLKIKDKRLSICTGILSIILATMSVIGEIINTFLDLGIVLQTSKLLFYYAIKWLANAFLIYIGTTILFYISNKKIIEKKEVKKYKFFDIKLKNFFVYWAIIFIAYIPYFFTYYPGIMTPDSVSQAYQTVGISELSNHHPIMHTFIINIFMQISEIFGNYNIGVALYSVSQMLVLSGVFAYTVYYMGKKNIPVIFRAITLIFYAIYPIHSMYSITMWKDIPFAISMLLFVILINEILINKDEFFKSKKKLLLFVLTMLLVVLFRNNGIYVVILTIPFIILFARNYYKQLLIVFACVILFYSVLWKGMVFNIFKVKEGSIAEALSIPLQQIARVTRDKADELTDNEREQINKLWPDINLAEIYNPTLSDNVKSSMDMEEFANNKGEFIKLWLGLVIKNPLTCVESFLCNCYGYWYPEAANWVVSRIIMEEENLNLHQTPIIQGNLVKTIDSYIDTRNIPILSMIFSVGFAMWLVFIQIAYIIYKKQYKLLLMFVPMLFLWLTNLASPVFCEFRYMYSLFTCLPMLLFVAMPKNEEKRKESAENE